MVILVFSRTKQVLSFFTFGYHGGLNPFVPALSLEKGTLLRCSFHPKHSVVERWSRGISHCLLLICAWMLRPSFGAVCHAFRFAYLEASVSAQTVETLH